VPLFNEASQAFFVGLAERGPTGEAIRVSSLEEFENTYGGFASYSLLHPTIECFFEEGGTQCYVGRVVGGAADVGSLELDDADGNATIVLTANGPGDWSTDVSAQVVSGTIAGTFAIKIFFDGEQIATTGNCTSREIAVGKINLHAEASKYITAELGADTSNPAVMANPSNLSAGDDDRAAVVDADYATALELFNDALGTGAVSCPESSSATVYSALIAHANEYNRIAILHGESNATISSIKSFAQTAIADGQNLEHAALYYPWVFAPTAVNGVNRMLPPDGYVAAKRSAIVNSNGSHIPYAGTNSQASFVNGVVTDIDRANGNALDDECINAIRIISNTVRIYGARSLSQDTTNFRYITSQDTVNSIVTDSYRAIEPLVFTAIDGRGMVFAAVEARLISVLEAYRLSGALFEAFANNGERIDYGYTVRCDARLNPSDDLADGRVKAKVGVRVSSIGDRIEVEIIKSSLTASVTA
jgi:hypothetical protein